MKTNDIGLTSALTSAGFKIESITSDGSKGTFFFQDDDLLQKAVAQYWDGELRVSARKMFEEIKIIKGRVRSL